MFPAYVPHPSKTPAELFNERWTGKSQDDVVVQYGQPTGVLPLTNGNEVYSYHAEVPLSRASGRGAYGVYGGGSSSDAISTTISCDRRFEIDKATLRVLRAVLSGRQCDPNK
jgi:hypothetical protein